ncbi:MAG: Uma2 family endonuclease [Myxococcales bacterium]|nr:Uma2 family endonuclease [Myxococcales bacterium]
MAADAAKKRATYQDVLDAPPNMLAEIIDCELHLQPRPGGPHADAASVLGMDIGSAFHRGRGGPGGWIILYEPELHLGEHVLVPDLAGWRRARLPEVPSTPAFELCPDWACEVLSPSTALVDRQKKLPIYAAEGVVHLCLVDPTARVVEVFRLDGDGYRFIMAHGKDEVVRLPPFEAIEIELGALWPSILPDAGRGG